MVHNAAEKEAICLCIAVEAIGDMANHALLEVLPLEDRPGEAEVRFQTREHQQLFLARLLDFVKETGDASLTGGKGPCLDVLRSACATRSFDVNGSVAPLQRAVEDFQCWLSAETPLRLWLPTLDVEAQLTVARRDLLFIAGNQSKHNLSRLTRVSQGIASLLRQHGHEVPVESIRLVLDDFRYHLQEDYFAYYGAWIAEHLTKIRWGIQSYLLPVYRQASNPSQDGGFHYSYTFPPTIGEKVAREWFWRLMNHVRSGPYIEPFYAARYLKEEVLRGDH
jgi:hypothetical protein